MNVLVTGGAGFLGSHIVDGLIRRGHAVDVVDDLSTGRRENVNPAARLLVRDFSLVRHEHYTNVDAIVHAAAVADISRNWLERENRFELWRTNVTKTFELLEEFLEHRKLERVVFISSAAVQVGPRSFYSASKVAGEELVAAYAEKTGRLSTSFRPVAMLGPRYRHGHVADFFRQWKDDGHIAMRSDGRRVAPYADVRAAAQTIVDLVDRSNDLPVPSMLAGAGRVWTALESAELFGCPVTSSSRETAWIGEPAFEGSRLFTDTGRAPRDLVLETIEDLKGREA